MNSKYFDFWKCYCSTQLCSAKCCHLRTLAHCFLVLISRKYFLYLTISAPSSLYNRKTLSHPLFLSHAVTIFFLPYILAVRITQGKNAFCKNTKTVRRWRFWKRRWNEKFSLTEKHFLCFVCFYFLPLPFVSRDTVLHLQSSSIKKKHPYKM